MAAIGVAASIFGLGINSFWVDEQFTVWVVGTDHDLAALAGRIVTDSHPPLCYLLVHAWAPVFGSGEVALRSFSLIASLAALVLFGVGTRRVFSIAARLCAVSLATTSLFWMLRAHNARSYGIAEVAVTALLVLALRLIDRERQDLPSGGTLAGLVAVMLGAVAIHFYARFVDVATLLVVFQLCPRRRRVVVARVFYDHYLRMARVAAMFVDDLFAGRTPPPSGCRVVAWQVHYSVAARWRSPSRGG